MTDQDQKVCDVCHERPATHHICYGNTDESRDLCLICFEQSASLAELESFRRSMAIFRDGKCKYCGAPAVGGLIGGVIEKRSDLWCEACRLDLVEFASRPENAMTKEEFMRQKIRERSR